MKIPGFLFGIRIQVLRMRNLREEGPPTPITPAKAGAQRKLCVAKQRFIY